VQLITVNCLNKQTLNTAATGFSLFLQNKAKKGSWRREREEAKQKKSEVAVGGRGLVEDELNTM